MPALKIIILEDEMIIAEDMAEKLENEGYEVVDICSKGHEALDSIAKLKPDLALLDIELKRSKLNGIQVAEEIMKKKPIPFIFVTAFPDDSVFNQAKATQPAAYITKPFKTFDLIHAIELAMDNFHNTANPENAAENNEPSETIFIKDRDRYHKIEVADILWIEADKGWTNIITVEKKHTLSGSLSEMEKKFSHPKIERVHRSFFVNTERIDSFDKPARIFVGDKEIPVGKNYRKDFFNKFSLL